MTISSSDRAAVERQLGRPVRGEVSVAVRCPCGLPSVIETHPLVDGEPFPTLYWLTCSRASQAVGRLEGAGSLKMLSDRVRTDDAFRAALEAATSDYVARRDALHVLEGAGGVGGGPSDRVKCLHAHLAHHLVCGCNPVGEWVMEQIDDVFHAPPCA